MATRRDAAPADLAADHAAGTIDLAELNRRAAEAGAAATTAEARSADDAGGLAGVTTSDVA